MSETAVIRAGRRAKLLGSMILALIAVAAAVPQAEAATGDLFGFAEQTDPDSGTSAPAFPVGPDARAFWAGVCDLDAADFAVGSDPGYSFSNCIDHPPVRDNGGINEPSDQLMPPLSPGLAVGSNPIPDGWVTGNSGSLGGPGWRLADVTVAGGHPEGSTSFWFSRDPNFSRALGTRSPGGPDGAPRSIRVSLPSGVLANPNAVPKCASEDLNTTPATCPPKTQVGVSTVSLTGFTAVYPVYNVEPRDGKTAEFIISGVGVATDYQSNAPIVAGVRTDDDFGADGVTSEIPSPVSFHSASITLWGVPWASSHDRFRPVAGYCHTSGNPQDPFGTYAWGAPGMAVQGLAGGTSAGCPQAGVSYDPSWGPIKPFFATQTECSPSGPVTKIEASNYNTSVIARADSQAPLVTGCELLPFDPSATFEPTATVADGPSGLDVDIAVPQNDDPPASVRFNPDDDTGAPAHWKSPAGRATAHLKDTVVRLPEGLSVNPSAATGLAGCSDEQVGLRGTGFAAPSPVRFTNDDPFDGKGPECPAGSVIGTVSATTPLLDETLTGQMVLGAPKSTDPQSGDMFRLFLVLRNHERGLVAKVYGTTVADPNTGRLTATFENNPQAPVDKIEVDVKGGDRGVLAMPRTCGERTIDSELMPWSAAHNAGGTSKTFDDSFDVTGDCTQRFAPNLNTGMNTRQARSNGEFSFKFSRKDGEQYLRGLTARLPQGLLASVKDVPLCSSAAADTGSCPAGSRIGIVDAKAGAGDPFVLEEKGEVFLTEGYKGGEYGLAVKVRPVAGPFRGQMELSPIIVRQAIHVDRTTAQVTAVSDPFPLIHHGVPLRVREVTVLVNRDKFMVNPSGCAAKQVGADIRSDQGATAGVGNAFQASGCAGLAFKPKLTLALTGRKQVKTGKHPGIKAVVTQQGVPEAGIEKAVVRLPKSLALDVNNAQALCEFVDGTKPDIENHCPKGSIVGRARAVSPLLNDPLVGNVYFVKNIRIDPKTGNQIRTLPMIVVALRGEVNVNLKGESDTQKGKLVNTFNNVPDAPISQFNLNINGGSKGIIAVTRTRRSLINLCASGRQIAEADMDGQNGRRHDFDVRMKTPCTKRQTKAAKRKAKRAAAKRAAAKSRK